MRSGRKRPRAHRRLCRLIGPSLRLNFRPESLGNGVEPPSLEVVDGSYEWQQGAVLHGQGDGRSIAVIVRNDGRDPGQWD